MTDRTRPETLFELWRQDDNGHRFLVGRFSDRLSADRRLAELTRSQHKQTYWITVKAGSMSQETPRNLFENLPVDLPEEFCEVIYRCDRVRIERILSRGHCSPEDFWYDQPADEFVLLLRGRATLEFADSSDLVSLQAGDWMVIKAHVRHRVAWTDPEQETVWLAVHY